MAIPLAIPLIMGAVGAGASLWGARKGAQGQRRARQHLSGMQQQAQQQYGAAQGRADDSRNQFMSAIQGFDPDAYMQRALSGDITAAHRALGEGQMQNRSTLNARGLLRSPIGNSRLMNGFSNQLAEAFANRSMQAAELQRSKVGMYQSMFGADQGQANQYQNAIWGMGNAQANSYAGQGDAWAQALGGIGGGMMGMGAGMYGSGNMSKNWFRG